MSARVFPLPTTHGEGDGVTGVTGRGGGGLGQGQRRFDDAHGRRLHRRQGGARPAQDGRVGEGGAGLIGRGVEHDGPEGDDQELVGGVVAVAVDDVAGVESHGLTAGRHHHVGRVRAEADGELHRDPRRGVHRDDVDKGEPRVEGVENGRRRSRAFRDGDGEVVGDELADHRFIDVVGRSRDLGAGQGLAEAVRGEGGGGGVVETGGIVDMVGAAFGAGVVGHAAEILQEGAGDQGRVHHFEFVGHDDDVGPGGGVVGLAQGLAGRVVELDSGAEEIAGVEQRRSTGGEQGGSEPVAADHAQVDPAHRWTEAGWNGVVDDDVEGAAAAAVFDDDGKSHDVAGVEPRDIAVDGVARQISRGDGGRGEARRTGGRRVEDPIRVVGADGALGDLEIGLAEDDGDDGRAGGRAGVGGAVGAGDLIGQEEAIGKGLVVDGHRKEHVDSRGGVRRVVKRAVVELDGVGGRGSGHTRVVTGQGVEGVAFQGRHEGGVPGGPRRGDARRRRIDKGRHLGGVEDRQRQVVGEDEVFEVRRRQIEGEAIGDGVARLDLEGARQGGAAVDRVDALAQRSVGDDDFGAAAVVFGLAGRGEIDGGEDGGIDGDGVRQNVAVVHRRICGREGVGELVLDDGAEGDGAGGGAAIEGRAVHSRATGAPRRDAATEND